VRPSRMRKSSARGSSGSASTSERREGKAKSRRAARFMLLPKVPSMSLAVTATVMLLVGGGFPANGTSAQENAGPSALPDWSGAWLIPEPVFVEAIFAEIDPKNPRAPKLTAANLARLNAFNFRQRTGQDLPGSERARTNSELCLPVGMPGVMRDPVASEYLFTSGRVTVISESGPTVRRIYTDPKSHPPLDPDASTDTGSSLGHWEGQTLVVETTHIKPGTQIIATVLTSGAARVTERMYLKDSKHLQIDTLLEDQGALTAPGVTRESMSAAMTS
jgi:hypothetical protein